MCQMFKARQPAYPSKWMNMQKNVSDISELAEMRKNDSKKVGHILVSL